MIIQHNAEAAYAAGNVKKNTLNASATSKKLSTGYRINSAADDAAALAISEKLRWQIRGMNRASDNIGEGVDVCKVADGALLEVHAILQRMNELVVQSANDTNTEEDRLAIQQEIAQLKEEINKIGSDTSYNNQKIFKATTVPEITGSPTDILIYHEDYDGGVREGGIIYKGRRYAYEDMGLPEDSKGNIKAGTYAVQLLGESGDQVKIDLTFSGGNRIPSGREYLLTPDNDGINIDGICYRWETLKDEAGNTFDKNAIQGGTYSFKHAGTTISFKTEDGMDLTSLIQQLKNNGIESYELGSTGATKETVPVNPSISMTGVTVKSSNQEDFPMSTATNTLGGGYKMHADANGVYMYIPAAYSSTKKDEKLTYRSWEDMGITDSMYREGDSINASSTVTGGEAYRQYTYKDDITGISISFTIDSEIAKSELIAAVNSWDITTTTSNKMNFKLNNTTSNGVILQEKSHSESLDAYGTQYEMGRDMTKGMSLAQDQKLKSSGGKFYFTLEDENGKTYEFASQQSESSIKTDVKNDMYTYVNLYCQQLERALNQGSSTVYPPADRNGTITFSQGSHMVNWSYSENFAAKLGLNKDMFNITSTVEGGVRKYSATLKSSERAGLEAKAADIAANVIDALKSAELTAKTDDGPVKESNIIESPVGVSNVRYTSGAVAGDMEMNIQSSSRAHDAIVIKLFGMNTMTLGIGGVDATSQESASEAISQIAGAIDIVSEMRTSFGATQNRLEHAGANDDNIAENSTAAESRLRDADMAEEMVRLAKHRILQQCGESLLAQTNSSKSNAMELLLQ